MLSTVGAFGLIVVAFAQDRAAPSVRQGVYTEAQAIRGQEVYYAHCLACHGEDMSGRDQAPPLAGPQFSSVWDGATLWALVERIGTMPPEQPGILSRGESVDLLTFMLWFNGLPFGEAELGNEKSVLEQTVFETPMHGQ